MIRITHEERVKADPVVYTIECVLPIAGSGKEAKYNIAVCDGGLTRWLMVFDFEHRFWRNAQYSSAKDAESFARQYHHHHYWPAPIKVELTAVEVIEEEIREI